MLPVLPGRGAAQTVYTVEGRVYDAGLGRGIGNAFIVLEGRPTVVTGDDGTFVLHEVPAGRWTVTVEAFGYVSSSATVTVDGDTRLFLPLDPRPMELEALVVTPTLMNADGRVRDPELGVNIGDAVVLSDQGHSVVTDTHGRFDLDDVVEGARLRLVVQAFGYLPVDTSFVPLPEDEERHVVAVTPDPLVDAMIQGQNRRLAARAGDHLYDFGAVVDRRDMQSHFDAGTLQSVMEMNYPRHVLERVGCFFLDEREIWDRSERTFWLQTLAARELQRVELLEFPGPGRMFMVRVYTRSYFRTLMARSDSLPVPEMRTGGVCG